MTRLILIGSLAAFALGSMVDLTRAEEPTRSEKFGLWMRDVVGTVGTSAKDTGKGLFIGDEPDCFDIDNPDKDDECLDEWIETLNLELNEAKLEKAGRDPE